MLSCGGDDFAAIPYLTERQQIMQWLRKWFSVAAVATLFIVGWQV